MYPIFSIKSLLPEFCAVNSSATGDNFDATQFTRCFRRLIEMFVVVFFEFLRYKPGNVKLATFLSADYLHCKLFDSTQYFIFFICTVNM